MLARKPTLGSVLRFAIRKPRDAIEVIVLGLARYRHFEQTPPCGQVIADGSPLQAVMRESTDIHEHLMTLYMLTSMRRLDPVLELGVRDGHSTVAFCEAAKEFGGRVISVDLEPCPEAMRRVKDLGFDRWRFVQADDMALPWNEPIGHLFIDSSHEYQHTLDELRKFEPYVRPGGLISLHDSNDARVKRAVDAFLADRPDLVRYTFIHNQGLTVLVKPGEGVAHETFMKN